MAEVDGQWRTYCHKECQWTDQTAFRPSSWPGDPDMGQLIGKREWETLYHGWNKLDGDGLLLHGLSRHHRHGLGRVLDAHLRARR